ncbi:hypothetical protein Tco_1402621 [Tanacetum coccineum]
MNDPIAVANKQNCWTIDYKQLNALYNDFVPQKESFVEQTCSSSSYIPFVKILETKTMPSELPLINELFNIKVGFEKLFLLIKQNSKRASMFYTSKEEIALNDFCRDQVKPLLNELLDYFDGFQNLFQRDIKEMKDAFEQNDVYLDEIERQNDLLKDQLLEASLKHDIELCVLLNHECVDKSLHDELEQVKKKSLEIQEGLKARIKILEKDVQRCEKQSVDFELKLQHEKEKHKWDSSKNKNSKPLDFSWISRIQKLEDENVSLDFKVQSLIKERDNAKMEYKKLFDSIKKTRSQTQKEMDELIAHVSEKTYAYGAIRAENKNLLDTISELKARLKNGENCKSVNTKFDKTHGMNATSSVRRPKSRDSHVKTSVLDVSKNEAKKEAVYVRKNKQTDNTFAKVVSNKENVIDVAVANTSKAKIEYTTYVASKSKIDEASASKAKDKVVQIVIWIVDSGCSKYMTGDRLLLRNFVEKFMGTVRFGNDNFAAITGYAYTYSHAGAWSRIQNPGQANGVLSYFSLRDEGAAADLLRIRAEEHLQRFARTLAPSVGPEIPIYQFLKKVTPRKLFNEESGEAGSENSQMSPSAEEVGGYYSDGSSRSRSQERPQTALKHQKNVSKKKGTSKSHMASRWKSSSDSGYDTVSNSGSEDLSMPYKRPKPMPFTSRITHFRYHRRAKLPPNVRVYEGNKDPEDHLSIFSAAAEQEEWPMPVWCKMFRQTLSGSARNWFDSLDPKSVDEFEELKSAHIKGVPPVLRISAFMHGHGHLELSKKLNDKIPKMVNEMWERVRAFIRGEVAADTTEAIRSPRWEKSAGKASWSEHQNGSRNRSHRRGKEETWGPVLPTLEEKASHL